MAVSWLEAHIAQAEHNINLFNKLHSEAGNNGFNDWKVTVLFYTALHLAHARVVVGLPPDKYKDRMNLKDGDIQKDYLTKHHYFNDLLNPTPKLTLSGVKIKTLHNSKLDWKLIELPENFNGKSIYNSYKQLYDYSRRARYLKEFNPQNNSYTKSFIADSKWINAKHLKTSVNKLQELIVFLQIHNQSIVDDLPTLNPV